MAKLQTSKSKRLIRHKRVRQKVNGSSQRPRLSVYRSLNHVYVQVIDDTKGKTLVAASSLDTTITEQCEGKAKSEISKMVGELIAKRAKTQGIRTVVFDRGGFKFHGRTKALADAARKGGLVF